MPPRTLATLAHALSVAPDLDASLLALAEALTEFDRIAQVVLVRYDARRDMIVDRLAPQGDVVTCQRLDTTFDQLSARERTAISAGGSFVQFGHHSDDGAPLFALKKLEDVGWLSLRGIRPEGPLMGSLVLYEPRKFFGTRSSERLAPLAGGVVVALSGFRGRPGRGGGSRNPPGTDTTGDGAD